MTALTDAQNALTDLQNEVATIANDMAAGLAKIDALLAAQTGGGGIAEADVEALATGIAAQTAALKTAAAQLEAAVNTPATPPSP